MDDLKASVIHKERTEEQVMTPSVLRDARGNLDKFGQIFPTVIYDTNALITPRPTNKRKCSHAGTKGEY